MIKILIGISGSGKSTYAKGQWEKDPLNTVIVNRDKIRELLYGYTEQNIYEYYSRADLNKLEKEVSKYEDTLIRDSIGKNIIIDATHLKREYLDRFRFWNKPIELVFFDIDLELAITRDYARNRVVGKEIIERQYNQYISLKNSLKDKPINLLTRTIEQDTLLHNCIIFDLDGTLAHMTGRNPYDWKKVKGDSVDLPVSELYTLLNTEENNTDVIICTGRDGSCEALSKEWLYENKLPHPSEFHIRKQGDMRPDWIIKEEMWRDISTRYNILFIVDDRQQVVDRARSLGIKVFQVEYHNF